MTGPESARCRVERFEHVPARYPLASRSGAEALAAIVAANRCWRLLGRRGRAAIMRAFRATLAVAQLGDDVPLPRVLDGTHPLTVAALQRRGMVADGRLTPLAVEVASWASLAAEATNRQENTSHASS